MGGTLFGGLELPIVKHIFTKKKGTDYLQSPIYFGYRMATSEIEKVSETFGTEV